MISDQPAEVDIRDWPLKSVVETDWFCESCGYNLIGQHVRQHPELVLLLVRCPECGRFFHPARQTSVQSVWLRRLNALGGWAYILASLVLFVGLAAAAVGITFATVEVQTTYDWREYQRQVTAYQTAATQPGAGPRPFSPTLTRVVRTDMRHMGAFVSLMYALTALLGFIAICPLTVMQHHWRRWHYLLAVMVLATAAPAIALLITNADMPEFFDWALPYIAAHGLSLAVGGVLAAFTGRICARALISALLPHVWRPHFAALWLADGRPPPPSLARPGRLQSLPPSPPHL